MNKVITRTVKTFSDLTQAGLLLQNQTNFPLQMTIKPGKEPRSQQQNRLAFQWYSDLDSQGDNTSEDYRAFCKLHFGVPILREDEDFRASYDATMKALDYETKIELIKFLEIPITSLMSVKQFTKYLDETHLYFSNKGIQLTDPSLLGIDDYQKWARA